MCGHRVVGGDVVSTRATPPAPFGLNRENRKGADSVCCVTDRSQTNVLPQPRHNVDRERGGEIKGRRLSDLQTYRHKLVGPNQMLSFSGAECR